MKVKDVVYCAATNNNNCAFKNSENICTARSGNKCVFSYMPSTEATKPPLGVMPRKMWDKQRQKDLADAMVRYLEAGMKIPAEWIEEYNEISDRLKEVKE